MVAPLEFRFCGLELEWMDRRALHCSTFIVGHSRGRLSNADLDGASSRFACAMACGHSCVVCNRRCSGLECSSPDRWERLEWRDSTFCRPDTLDRRCHLR